MTTYPGPHFDSLTLDSLTPLRGAGAAVLFNGVFSETTYLGLVSDTVVQFTADTLGTLMTVSAVASGTLAAGMLIRNPTVLLGVKENTTISAQLSGTAGGAGTYVISQAQTVSSTSLQAIATTHGVANSAVMNAAILAGKPLFVPKGNYYLAATVTSALSDVCIVGLGGPVFWLAPGITGNAFSFSGNRITLRGLTIVGHVYNAFADVALNNTMLRCQSSGHPLDIRLEDCVLIGGLNACVISSAVRVWISGCRVYGSYQWGIIVSGGCQQVFISDYIAEWIGTTEGIKLGASGELQVYDSIQINGFYIAECGHLDTTVGNWQEGIDLFAYALKNVQISNGQIINCGNGGIEFKLQTDVVVAPGTYLRGHVSNVYIEYPYDKGGAILFNRTGGASPSPDQAGEFRIDNVHAVYTGGGVGASGLGISIAAYTDVEICNSTFNGFHQAIRLNGSGSSDNTVRRPKIKAVTALNCGNGISFSNGALEGLEVSDCSFSTTDLAIYLQSGTSTIARNNLASSGAAGIRIDAGTHEITANLITSATSFGINMPIVGTTSINRNRITSALDAVRADGGTHEISDNRISVPTTKRGWATTGTPTVSPVNNRLGFNTVAPTIAGAVGDVVANSAPGTPPALGWICTVAGASGAATWTVRTT